MALVKAICRAEKVIVPSPLGLQTLGMMGIVKRATPSKYVLVVPSLDDSEDESDDPEDAQMMSALYVDILFTLLCVLLEVCLLNVVDNWYSDQKEQKRE